MEERTVPWEETVPQSHSSLKSYTEYWLPPPGWLPRLVLAEPVPGEWRRPRPPGCCCCCEDEDEDEAAAEAGWPWWW